MPGNSFGQFFKITSWGESHGKALGVVVDGCPAGIKLNEKDIQTELDKRKPGQSRFTTPRKESDKVQILSGTFKLSIIARIFFLSAIFVILLLMPPFLIVFGINTQYLPASEIRVVKAAPLLPLSSFVT